MSHVTPAPAAYRPPLSAEQAQRDLLRWICTSNPFYVLSAGLFLAGLWVSIEAQASDVQTWALMAGLVGYTLLLAVTAFLLVRLGGVWDDVRTVLLLVVLMFLAASVTFDEELVSHPQRGQACYLVGLLCAVAISEGILRGTRLLLPGWFRAAYYLLLALFFLYPLALSPFSHDPHSEELMWGLFGFSTAAGLASLTLLPAIRRGSDYVKNCTSAGRAAHVQCPWRWPLYPWVLFGVLGFAVPARAVLLCWSMQLLSGGDRDQIIFGGYFLVPFGLAIGVLLVELARVTSRRSLIRAVLATPGVLVLLALLGHRSDPIYQEFLQIFTTRLGFDPLSLTLLVVVAFYGYAAIRRIAGATEGATVALICFAVVNSQTLDVGEPSRWYPAPLSWPVPILAAALLQLGLGLRRRRAWRCLVGGLLAILALADAVSPLRTVIAFHLTLLVVLAVGAAFDDDLGYLLRLVGGAMVLLACMAVEIVCLDGFRGGAAWILLVYPVVMAALLAGYGWTLGSRVLQVIAGLCLVGWVGVVLIRGYLTLRGIVPGTDYLAVSLVLFGLAVLISLGKAGVLSRWIDLGQQEEPTAGELAERPATGIQLEPPAAPLVPLAAAPVGGEIQQESPRDKAPE